jgi:hypothetical protein
MVQSMGRNLDDHRSGGIERLSLGMEKARQFSRNKGTASGPQRSFFLFDPLPIRFHLHFLCLAARIKNTVRLTIVDDELIHHLREEFLYSRKAQPSL